MATNTNEYNDGSLTGETVTFEYSGSVYLGIITLVINAPETEQNPYLIESSEFASAGGIPRACKEMRTKGQIYLKRREFQIAENK
jgi:hypothetical protein